MIAPGQHRLKRLQLVNWGTFDHYVDLPVPRRGLLITGESGSGKTSILDAIAVVLVPPGRVRLNAAAQEGDAGDRSRNLLTYVRGAYKREADSASGEPVTAYLRPGAAWSAICLTYDNGLGKTTSLLRLMHVASSATSTRDVRSLFMMAEEPVDLLSLEPYAENGLDMRKLKTAYPNWTITPTYSGFAQRMQRSFSLENDQAQLLLHKTQSAKNLSSLDALLRDFMLDPPDTYDLVEQAIEQFNELSAAHSSVVDAREQVDSLTRLENHAKRRATIIEQLDMLTAEREHLEAHTLGLSMIEEEAELERLLETVVALDTEVNLAESALAVRRAEQESARRAVDGLGGRELEILERERQLASTQLDLIQKTKNRFLDLAEQAGLELPESHAEFGRFNEQIAEQLAHAEESAEQREQRFNLTAQADQATSARRAIEQQLQTLEAQRSTLDVRLLDLRRLLAQTAGVASERLGFAGELISVRADQAIWTGAIERVLRNLAQTLLVPDDLYPLVSDYVDRNHLGQRLVYQRIPNQFEQVADPDDQRSLIYKVDIAPSEHADWLYTDLVRRFDYLCVQNAAELRTVRRGVTLTGQVKHSSSRHEKDDRSRIDDQSRWVLGSSLEMKRTALLADLERLRSIENEAKHQRDEQESQLRLQQGMARILSELSQLDWQMIDIQSRQIEFDRISAQITTLLSEQEDLARAQALLKRAELAVNDTEQSMNKLRDRRSRTQQQFDTKAEHLDKITLRFGVLAEVPAAVAERLGERIETIRSAKEPGQIMSTEDISRELREFLEAEDLRINGRKQRAENRVIGDMSAYKHGWAGQAKNLGTDIEYLEEYLAVLEALRTDRLPEFENRFFSMLQKQSRNNIGDIAQVIQASRREIKQRVDPINKSLSQTEYSPGRHLWLRVVESPSSDVRAFLDDLSKIVSGSLEDNFNQEYSDEDRQQAEVRYKRIADLLGRLESQEPADQAWRRQCLDTRLHVRFIAEVRDTETGGIEDIYSGAGGLSGGERQKLVVFCLAAALRYQLAREGASQPTYGLVALDEAFDKTDPAFTKAGLDVFASFGFQLLLATPLKMLQTLEGYVGGAVQVSNREGEGSRCEKLIWETDDYLADPAALQDQTLQGYEQCSLL